ncbi:MAG: hypothetical protein ACLGQX_06130 [Acidobacteriota bacterium]|jgi:hypothetical protein
MRMRLRVAEFLVTVAMGLCLCLSLERRAYAYIDPGSGLLMLQALGAVFTGFLYAVRKRIRALFRRDKPVEPQPTGPNREG